MDIVLIAILVALAGMYMFRRIRKTTRSGGCGCGCNCGNSIPKKDERKKDAAQPTSNSQQFYPLAGSKIRCPGCSGSPCSNKHDIGA